MSVLRLYTEPRFRFDVMRLGLLLPAGLTFLLHHPLVDKIYSYETVTHKCGVPYSATVSWDGVSVFRNFTDSRLCSNNSASILSEGVVPPACHSEHYQRLA